MAACWPFVSTPTGLRGGGLVGRCRRANPLLSDQPRPERRGASSSAALLGRRVGRGLAGVRLGLLQFTGQLGDVTLHARALVLGQGGLIFRQGAEAALLEVFRFSVLPLIDSSISRFSSARIDP